MTKQAATADARSDHAAGLRGEHAAASWDCGQRQVDEPRAVLPGHGKHSEDAEPQGSQVEATQGGADRVEGGAFLGRHGRPAMPGRRGVRQAESRRDQHDEYERHVSRRYGGELAELGADRGGHR